MDLIIKKTKFNKNFFLNETTSNSTNNDVCYIKINMTLFNKTINLDQESQNHAKNRLEDKDIKFDIDKINLLQKNELNKTNVIDQEVQINNNLKLFLNSHLKSLNMNNALKINSFIVKKLVNTIDDSVSKRSANNNNFTYSNNTHNSSDGIIRVKKILNLERNNSAIFEIKNITNYTIMNDTLNLIVDSNFNSKINEKKNQNNNTLYDESIEDKSNVEKISADKEKIITNNKSNTDNKSNFFNSHNPTFITLLRNLFI